MLKYVKDLKIYKYLIYLMKYKTFIARFYFGVLFCTGLFSSCVKKITHHCTLLKNKSQLNNI